MAEKKIAITGTISPELREAVENYRWDNRMSLSDVVTQALGEWADKRGVSVEKAEPEPETKAKK